MDRSNPSGPKRQHFVPEMLQKRFLNKNGKLWYVRKSSLRHPIEIGPKQAFVESYIYSEIENDQTKNPRLENAYAILEGGIDPLLSRICDISAKYSRIDFSEDDKQGLVFFLYNQLRRAPDFYRRIARSPEIQAGYDRIFQDLEQRFPQQADELQRLRQEPELSRTLHNVQVRALGHQSEKVLSILNKMTVCLKSLRKENKSFVLSSVPVLKMGSPNLQNKLCQLWMPISSKVAIGLTWDADNRCVVEDLADHDLRRLNVSITSQSSAIASSSADLLRSLVRTW